MSGCPTLPSSLLIAKLSDKRMPLHFVSTRREEFYLWDYQMLFFFLDCWNSTERWIYSESPLTLLRRWDLAKFHWSAIMQQQATCRLSVLSAFTPTLMWKNKRVSNTIVTGQWVILSPETLCGGREATENLFVSVLENISCWNVFCF